MTSNEICISTIYNNRCEIHEDETLLDINVIKCHKFHSIYFSLIHAIQQCAEWHSTGERENGSQPLTNLDSMKTRPFWTALPFLRKTRKEEKIFAKASTWKAKIQRPLTDVLTCCTSVFPLGQRSKRTLNELQYTFSCQRGLVSFALLTLFPQRLVLTVTFSNIYFVKSRFLSKLWKLVGKPSTKRRTRTKRIQWLW